MMKICKKCGKPIFRKVYEEEYNKRAKDKLRDYIWSNVNYHYECSFFFHTCQGCGKEFTTRNKIPRKYCSHKCAGENNPVMKSSIAPRQEPIDETLQRKQCIMCGAIFHRKRYSNGRLLPTRNWRKQKYCSRQCADKRFKR